MLDLSKLLDKGICMKMLLVLFLFTALSLAQGVKQFSNERVGISFSYPAEWEFINENEYLLELSEEDTDINITLNFVITASSDMEETFRILISESKQANYADSVMKEVVSSLTAIGDTMKVDGSEFLKIHQDYGPVNITYYLHNEGRTFVYAIATIVNNDKALIAKNDKVIQSIKFLTKKKQ